MYIMWLPHGMPSVQCCISQLQAAGPVLLARKEASSGSQPTPGRAIHCLTCSDVQVAACNMCKPRLHVRFMRRLSGAGMAGTRAVEG